MALCEISGGYVECTGLSLQEDGRMVTASEGERRVYKAMSENVNKVKDNIGEAVNSRLTCGGMSIIEAEGDMYLDKIVRDRCWMGPRIHDGVRRERPFRADGPKGFWSVKGIYRSILTSLEIVRSSVKGGAWYPEGGTFTDECDSMDELCELSIETMTKSCEESAAVTLIVRCF